MYFPTTVAHSLSALFVGLVGSGCWPAVRNAIRDVHYSMFNITFVPAMTISGLLFLTLLTAPKHDGEMPDGLVDYTSLWDAVVSETTEDNMPGLLLSMLSGVAVGVSNFILSAAMPLAGCTRVLPVFNGVAIAVGVSIAYKIQGNPHPLSLFCGMGFILGAIMLTFLSRQLVGAEPIEIQVPGSPVRRFNLGSTHILSAQNLTSLIGAASEEPLPLAGSVPLKVDDIEMKTKRGSGSFHQNAGERQSLIETKRDDEKVMGGLVLALIAGAIDGSWSSLTLVAKMKGIPNYVTGSYFMFGVLIPAIVAEILVWAMDRETFNARYCKLTLFQMIIGGFCGTLNIFGIVSYFVATFELESAVAFAIFLSTPLVSITLSILLGELTSEPRAKKVLVGTILSLYIIAISLLAYNAMIDA